MQQKHNVGLGFRGWMLAIYQFLAYLAMVCFTNWPMNGLGDLYGGAQSVSSIFTIASVVGIVVQLILSRNIGKIRNIKQLSIILGIIAMVAALGVMVVPPSSLGLWKVFYFIACLVIIVWCTFIIGILIGQWFPRRKGTVMGIVTIAFPIGNALMQPFLSTVFAGMADGGAPNVLGGYLPFFIIICIGIVIGAVFVKDYPEQCGAFRDNDQNMTAEKARAMMEQEIENKRTTVWTLANTFKCPDFWLITIPMGLLLAGSVGMMTQTANLFVSYGVNAQDPQFGLILLVNAIFAIAGSYILGLLDTKIGTRKSMMIAMALMVVAGILGAIHSFQTTVAALWILGIFMGASSNFTVSGSVQYWRIEDFPSVFARVNPLANLFQAVAPVVIATLMFMNGAPDATGPFIFVAVSGVVSLILLVLFKPERVKAYDDKYRKAAGKPLDNVLAGRK